jgi:hypothetical protein
MGGSRWMDRAGARCRRKQDGHLTFKEHKENTDGLTQEETEAKLQALTNEIRSLEKQQLTKLKESSILQGLAPLYQDYTADYYWFEVLQFCATLFLTAIAASLPVDSASVLFLALLVSTVMLLVFSNACPYVSRTDDALAQVAQATISLALMVGLLGLSDTQEYRDDSAYGILLVMFSTMAVSAPAIFVFHLLWKIILACRENDPTILSWTVRVYGVLCQMAVRCESILAPFCGTVRQCVPSRGAYKLEDTSNDVRRRNPMSKGMSSKLPNGDVELTVHEEACKDQMF